MGSSGTGSPLKFPLEPPAVAAATAIADDVLWLRLPGREGAEIAPGAPVNAYAIAEDHGWRVVDCGYAGPETEQAWDAVLSGPLGARPVTGVIALSADAASVGAAGWLCARFDIPLQMSRGAYLTAQMRRHEAVTGAPEALAARAGANAGAGPWPGHGDPAELMGPLPRAFVRLADTHSLMVGRLSLRILSGGAGGPEATCLWSPEAGLLWSGISVMAEGQPPAGVIPREPAGDPMGDYLAALWRIMAVAPEDVTVLPARGGVFTGLHARIEATATAHEEAVARVLSALKKDVDAAQIAKKQLGGVRPGDLALALAYLNYLERRGYAAMAHAPGKPASFRAVKDAPALEM